MKSRTSLWRVSASRLFALALTAAFSAPSALRGYTFEYEDHAVEHRLALPGKQVGLIAQEVAEVFPDWVDADDEGYLYITERGLTAIVVEALRELRDEKDAEIQLLRTANDAQQSQIDTLRNEVAQPRDLVMQLTSMKERAQ